MLPYENIQIGYFLICIGYQLRALNKPIPLSLNLLQQTPLDAKAGDLLGGINNQYFIIEFKRDFKSVDREYSKPKYESLIKELKENNSLLYISHQCHFLSYGKEYSQKQVDYTFLPYLSKEKLGQKEYSIQSFLVRLFDSKIGTSYENFKKYTELLNKCYSSSPISKPNSFSGNMIENMSGILVSYDKEGKILSYIFNSLEELKLSLDFKNEINIGKTLNEDRTKGMSM